MKKIKYIAVALALMCCSGLYAQNKGLVTLKLNYTAGVPMGSFKDAIGNTSWKGFGAELMYHVNDAFSVGLETGSQEFYQKNPRQLYKAADGSDISAVLSNSITTVPILLRGQYNFLQHQAVQPYVAVAAGGNIVAFNQYAGSFSNDAKTRFGFAARPEAGVYIPFGKYSHAGFTLGAGYNIMPFNYAGISNLNNLTVRAGISFPLGQ
jgi:hypothetical protein